MKKPVLVVMAAGMGSRYGGLKQIDPIDKEGHIIMDFSIYDAVRAGFEKVVFIIKKENEQAKQKALQAEADAVIQRSESLNGFNVLFMEVNNVDGNLKEYAETLRNKLEDSIVFLTSNVNDKLTFVCACSKKAVNAGIKAGDLVKKAAEVTNGKGGGRPDIAQAGGKDLDKVTEAINLVKEIIKNA